VLDDEIFVRKLFSVDGFAARAIAVGEIATLGSKS
jgi:hypothetical protein